MTHEQANKMLDHAHSTLEAILQHDRLPAPLTYMAIEAMKDVDKIRDEFFADPAGSAVEASSFLSVPEKPKGKS